jgi:RecJ-like exonuclease
MVLRWQQISCPACQGEGYSLRLSGIFADREEVYLPSESLEPCPDCAGEGVLEVCAVCLQVPAIMNGCEVCECEVQVLPRAA